MRLTQKQEQIITRYAREVNECLPDDLSERARERGFARLQARIEHELTGPGRDSINDEDVLALMQRLGPPETVAASFAPRRQVSETLALSAENRVWLGVCAGVAENLDIAPWLARGLAMLLGLTTGPLAILIYLGLYFRLYASAGADEPRIAKARALWRSLSTVIIACALRYGSLYAVRLVYYVHEHYLHRPIPELGPWAWFHARDGELFFWAIVICTPLALLSAMPLANAWDLSLRRMNQALLALYGVALSFGIASILTGLILDFVKEFTG